jgi:hypothetical protein
MFDEELRDQWSWACVTKAKSAFTGGLRLTTRQTRVLAAVFLREGVKLVTPAAKNLLARDLCEVSHIADRVRDNIDNDDTQSVLATFRKLNHEWYQSWRLTRPGVFAMNAYCWNLGHYTIGAILRADSTDCGMVAHNAEAMCSADSDKAAWCKTTGDILVNLTGRGWKFDPSWRTSAAISLAQEIGTTEDWAGTPVLADALQEAGMPEDHKALAYLRGDEAKFKGAWILDQILGKE